MAEVFPVSTQPFELQSYESKDTNLISQRGVNTSLSGDSTYIEFFIYNLNQELLYSTYNYTNFTVENDGQSAGKGNSISEFNISPEDDIFNNGFGGGSYVAYYNFLNQEIGTPFINFFISEISSDRTEIRLDSTSITNTEKREETNTFIRKRENSDYFLDFYLNFSSNDLVIANNIKLDNSNSTNPTIVVKLYEPLPSQFSLRDQLWIVTTLNPSEAFQVDDTPSQQPLNDSIQLKGPNLNLPIKGQVNNSSEILSYNDIFSSAPSSSQDQIKSLLEESSINISVDYTDFNDFIHFSSAQTRIENFNYKVGLIESYSSSISGLSEVTSSTTSQLIFENKISNVVENFDKFEYFMYYNSGSSFSWPKTTSSPPYLLAKTDSSTALNWLGSANESNQYFGGLLLSASNFDNSNNNELKKSIPEYLREDSDNLPYDLFVDMVAQYYDNIWLHTKDITQKYNADNRLDFGVSKDLVADAIKDFGVKLYQNNFSTKDLYTGFLGITSEGSTFPFPEITGSGPASTGMEIVDTLISASNDIIPMSDVNKSLYKRIYHNIPYLLKSKGTIPGLRALITSYGIPDTILKISEFGGKDQVNANDYDLYFDNFNYAFDTTNNFISSSWEVKNTWGATNNRPSTIQFRFKAEDILPTNLTQSLWHIQDSSDSTTNGELYLEYTGSGLSTSSYGGSSLDPYYQYATLKFAPYTDEANTTASVYLPFFDGGWWSVMVEKQSSGTYNLYAGNKIYNGKDGTSVGYYASNSITGADNSPWEGSDKSTFAAQSIYSSQRKPFSGSLQEIRYYNTKISESVFKDFIMNPLSFEGNGVNSAPDQLTFRAALGSELDINTSSSIHPKVTGSWATTSSFSSTSNFYFNTTPLYSTNTETLFLDQPAVGIKNRINDKIRFENNVVPSGDTLSPFRRITQQTETSASYTDSINYLEVAFSPQNQINDDIIGQMGHFNIGDYIGDPKQRFSGNIYPDLNSLSEDYFKKYLKSYDLTDFVRLIKFFDNSLFKMIKDFIPVRTSLASGLVIKQHLLERNKYPQPQVSYSDESELSGSINMYHISGGAGGVFNKFNSTTTSPSGSLGQGPDNTFNITQSWFETTLNLSGSVTKLHDSQDEFYDGEFSGSIIEVSNGELNSDCDPFKEPSFKTLQYGIRHYNEFSSSLAPQYQLPKEDFQNPNNLPFPGYIATCYGKDPSSVGSVRKIFGIVQIKISKLDSSLTDRTNEIKSFQNLTLRFNGYPGGPTPSIPILKFKIISRVEFQDYFFLKVETDPEYLIPPPYSSLTNQQLKKATELYPDIPISSRVDPPQLYRCPKNKFIWNGSNISGSNSIV